ncbi:MAG: hypothetical protein AAF483_25965 [Planctomycetota bacterium]
MSSNPAPHPRQAMKPNWMGVILYAFFIGLADFAFAATVAQGPFRSGTTFFWPICYGLVVGQIGFLSVLGSWCGRHWIQGFALSTILGAACLLLAGLSLLGPGSEFPFSEYCWVVFLVPSILTSFSVPLWIARALAGRRLTLQRGRLEKSPTTIRDFFILTAFIGVQFYLYTIVVSAWEIPSWESTSLISGAAAYAGISLISFLPMGIIAFSHKDAVVAFGWQCLFGFVFFVLAILILLGASSGRARSEDIAATMLLFASATISFASGCAALHAAGVRWKRVKGSAKIHGSKTKKKQTHQATPSKAATNSPWDESEDTVPASDETEQPGVADERPIEEADSPSPAKNDGSATETDTNEQEALSTYPILFEKMCTKVSYSIGVLLLFAFAGALASFALDRSRLAEIAAYNGVGAKLLAEGGAAYSDRDNNIVALKFGPATDNADLEEFTKYRGVTEIDLSDSQIDDGAIDFLLDFPALRFLNLANTDVSAKSIERIVSARGFDSLVLAGIPLQEDELGNILAQNKSNLRYLDISDCGLSMETLNRLWDKLPKFLSIRGFGLTDLQLEPLLLRDAKTALDLRDNELAGDFLLLQVTETWRVRLEGNPITNAAIQASAGKCNISQISLGRNRLTDKCLRHLMRHSLDELTISDSSFSEAAITKHILCNGQFSLERLAIHDPNFKGLELDQMSDWIDVLDLSHSGVTSKAFALFDANLSYIDLSNTSVDVKGIELLQQSFAADKINISHCAIQAGDLRTSEFFHRGTKLQVPLGHFSDRELMMLQRERPLSFGNGSGKNLTWLFESDIQRY